MSFIIFLSCEQAAQSFERAGGGDIQRERTQKHRNDRETGLLLQHHITTGKSYSCDITAEPFACDIHT